MMRLINRRLVGLFLVSIMLALCIVSSARGDSEIGYSTVGATSYVFYGRCLGHLEYTYMAEAGDTVVSFSLYCHSGGESATFQAAVYTVSGGVPSSRVGDAVSHTFAASSYGWQTVSASIPLTQGVEYTICVSESDGSITLAKDAITDGMSRLDECTTLPATWSEDSRKDYLFSFFASISTGEGSPDRKNFRRRKVMIGGM